MPSPRNTFSAHILSSENEEPEPLAPKQSAIPPKPVLKTESPTPSESKATSIREPEEPKARLDYRKTRADKEGKKYINILIDKDLQSELKPRMVTRNLTWESLVEGLLRRWLEENPGYKP